MNTNKMMKYSSYVSDEDYRVFSIFFSFFFLILCRQSKIYFARLMKRVSGATKCVYSQEHILEILWSFIERFLINFNNMESFLIIQNLYYYLRKICRLICNLMTKDKRRKINLSYDLKTISIFQPSITVIRSFSRNLRDRIKHQAAYCIKD